MNGQTKKGECEVCEKKDITITCHYGNMWFCDDCWLLEEQATAVNSVPSAQSARITESRIAQNTVIAAAQAIDNSINIRTELFNAATVSIMDLKKAIDEDANIQNKPYALAEELTKRFEHFKQVVFSLNEQLMEAGNQQKAIHVYLNNMANQLRAEEREKLKIADLNYQPKALNKPTVRKIGTSTTTKKVKIDKTEVAKYVKELGVSEFMIHQICLTKNCSVAEAAAIIKKSIDDAKGK